MSDRDPIYELGSTLAVVRRRAGIVLLLTALSAGAALVVSILQPQRYEATATLLLRALALEDQIINGPLLFGSNEVYDRETNQGLVALDSIARLTEGKPGAVGTASEISDAITVDQGAGPGLVEVTASGEDPKDAASLANAYASTYVGTRRSRNRDEVRRARQGVERKLSSLPPELQGTVQAHALRRQLLELDTLAALRVSDAEVVGEAVPPTDTSTPSTARNTIVGGLAGLVLGLVAAFLLEHLSAYRLASHRR